MDKLEMENRILRLERLVTTLTQFANENMESFEEWVDDNKELDPNVNALAEVLEASYQ